MQMFSALLAFYMLISLNAQDELKSANNANPEWCWTVPDYQIKVQPNKFGYNYGLCKSNGKNEDSPTIKTKISVKMHDIKGFGGESGPFKMRMSSSEISGNFFTLNDGIFQQNQNYQTEVMVPSVGEVTSVDILVDDNETGNFACDSLTIEDGPKNYEFKCQGIIDSQNKQLSLARESLVEYEITVVATEERDGQTKDPVWVALGGSKGKTEYILFAEEIMGEPVMKTVLLPDMGTISCIYLKSYSSENLHPTNVKLTTQGGQELEFKNDDQQEVNCPKQCGITFCKGSLIPPPAVPQPPPNDSDVIDDEPEANPPAYPKSPFPDTGLYNCAKLNAEEKDSLKKITCKTLGNQIFEEENYLDVNLNYDMKFVNCPSNCMKDAAVMGRGIHNPSSNICAAAIADGSMPKSGGCVAVAKMGGLSSYASGKLSNGVKVTMGSSSPWSFITYKADNTDFSKSDIRILNYKGEPDYEGRVEFRVSGKWGTVNIKGSEQSAAHMICKTLNYADGEFLNDEKQNFCESFNEKDYCGFKGQEVFYQGYKCDGDVEALSDCYREIAQEFNHQDDAIIRCSMTNKKLTSDVQPQDMEFRIVGTNQAPSQDNMGRVEVFTQKQWGSVCNQGFNDHSADVLCKQLGFTGGSTIGEPGKFNACKYGKEDFCDKTSKMLISKLACTGKEKDLKDCGGQKNPKCSYEQAAMVKCEGEQGDTSAVSRHTKGKQNKIQKPQLGNLPLPNPYRINCETKLTDLDFPGDPGSIYLVSCPAGCLHSDAKIAGTGIYTYDSSICKAAIHSGVVQPYGGGVTVIITYGQPIYQGTLHRGVESIQSAYMKKSFLIGAEISIHKAWSLVNYSTPTKGLIGPHNNVHHYPKIAPNPTSFTQFKTKYVHSQIQNVADSFRSYLKKINMLQMKQVQVNPIFEWVSPKNYKFTGKESPDFSDLEKDDQLAKIQTFTILTQFEVEQNNGIVEIFGHSECECWGLIFSPNGLEFGPKCKDNMVNLGFQLALNKKYHIGISYDHKTLMLRLVVNGKLIYADKHSFKFNCQEKVNIGYNSFSKSKYLIGKISYVNVFKHVISQNELIVKTVGAVPSVMKPGQSISTTEEGQKIRLFTQDKRKCVSPCITDPFPEQLNAPEPPPPARLGVANGGPGSEGGIGPEEQQEDKEDVKPPLNPDANDLQCDDTLDKEIFQGQVGKEILVYCAKGCAESHQLVIGSQIYYRTSSICKAGIHDGKISNKEGGELIVTLANPLNHYEGISINSITSKELQIQDAQIAFTLKHSQKVYDIKCDTVGTDSMFDNAVGTLQIKCPAQCSFQSVKSYGTNKFSSSSQICQSAIHAGASSDHGGQFGMIFTKAENIYQASTKNQIKSKLLDNSSKAITKSLVFLANKPNTCGFFKETYREDLSKNWEVRDVEGAKGAPSEWKYVPSPRDSSKTVLAQESEIENITPGKYSTMLFHKKFDCSNGLFKVNVYMRTKAEFAIFVRYYDDNNYYAFKFNVPGEPQIKLVRVSAGVEKELGSYKEDLVLMDFNRLYIVFDQQTINLNLQQGSFRNIPLVISATDDEVQRGKVAFATNKENNVKFDGIEIQPYDINTGIMDQKSQNRRIWDDCLKPASLQFRQRYCKKMNGSEKWAIPLCKKIINYCEYCCAAKIKKWEKIIFYNCQKTCVQSTRNYEKLLKKKDSNSKAPYVPKKGDKIDFLQFKSKKFIPAFVKDVSKGDQGELNVEVSFFMANQEYFKETVSYPNPKQRIQACGTVLNDRLDCDDKQ